MLSFPLNKLEYDEFTAWNLELAKSKTVKRYPNMVAYFVEPFNINYRARFPEIFFAMVSILFGQYIYLITYFVSCK